MYKWWNWAVWYSFTIHFLLDTYISLSLINYELNTWFCIDNRQRGRLAGFSLYLSNTGAIQGSYLCYKDGPQLPPLNFTTECIESGRYVIFYNERFDGVSYPTEYELSNVFTELCEVIVKGILYVYITLLKCSFLFLIYENRLWISCLRIWRHIS